jgi:hypothetical protein
VYYFCLRESWPKPDRGIPSIPPAISPCEKIITSKKYKKAWTSTARGDHSSREIRDEPVDNSDIGKRHHDADGEMKMPRDKGGVQPDEDQQIDVPQPHLRPVLAA